MALGSYDYSRDLFTRRWMEGRAGRANLTSREVFQWRTLQIKAKFLRSLVFPGICSLQQVLAALTLHDPDPFCGSFQCGRCCVHHLCSHLFPWAFHQWRQTPGLCPQEFCWDQVLRSCGFALCVPGLGWCKVRCLAQQVMGSYRWHRVSFSLPWSGF